MFDYPMPPFRPSVLSTKVHTIWNCLAGLVLIGSSWLIGFEEDLQARWPMLVAGGLVLATVTDYEGGLFKKVLMTLHLGFDRLIGSLLDASPWLLGFADRVYWPHLSLGLLLLVVGLITKRKPPYKKIVCLKAGVDQ